MVFSNRGDFAMCFTHNLKAIGALLIAGACLFPNQAPGANSRSSGRTNAARVPAKSKAKNLPSQIHLVPRVIVQSASTGRPAKKLVTALRSAKTVQLTQPKLSKIKNAVPSRVKSDTPSAGSPKPKAKSAALRPSTAANESGLSSIRPRQSNFEDIAQRAGRIRTKVSDQVGRDLNSSSAAAIGNAMPGFADRGAKGASGLRDMGSTGGDQRNPVTNAGSLSDFTGGGTGRYSEGGKGSSTATHNQDGSTTLAYQDGTVIDVWKDGTIVTQNPDGTTEVDSGTNSPTKYYDKDGKFVGTTPPSGSKKTGSAGEPIDDPTGSGGSGRPVVTAETLRGLAARLGNSSTPTGDEGTSGGPVDDSKTRQGRVNQVGQPVDDSPAVRVTPTAADVKQVMRLRMRNVTPIQR
jgi:hypothetical protein